MCSTTRRSAAISNGATRQTNNSVVEFLLRRADLLRRPASLRRREPEDHVAVALARTAHRAEAVDRRLVQANDHVALVGRAGGPRLRVGRQGRLNRRVGFGGDRNSDPGTGGQRDLPPHVCWAGVR
jgi:hypothetical protein